MESPIVKRALLSVSDKTGLTDFARGLVAAGVELLSTGGTRKHLENAGIPVCDISKYTSFPEMMEGRLKTLHPKVHGGILCRRNNPDDMLSASQHGIVPFELVVVNLYPFAATVAKPDVTWDLAIENIDIGGPTMVRAASKNHDFVTIATDPGQYAEILSQIQSQGCTTLELRRRLAGEAFAHTAQYDRAIADFFAGERSESGFPGTYSVTLRRQSLLRYGENPHQLAAVYATQGESGTSLVAGRQLHGKELSYNNLLDLDSAMAIVRSFADPAAVVIKHNNPCGAAEASTLAEALKLAMAGDPLSAFGSVLGLNRTVDAATADVLTTPGLFVEAIVAPEFSPEAVEILTTKPKWKANVRLVAVGPLGPAPQGLVPRFIAGGALLQQADVTVDPESDWKVVTRTQPTGVMLNDLRFAWEMVRHVKSNAIVICRDRMLLGAGAGQMSRVDSTEIAVAKSGERARGAVLGSDAFFPFPDSVERAAAAGVVALIQPGGSKNDNEVIAACDRLGLAMVFTGRRHFKH